MEKRRRGQKINKIAIISGLGLGVMIFPEIARSQTPTWLTQRIDDPVEERFIQPQPLPDFIPDDDEPSLQSPPESQPLPNPEVENVTFPITDVEIIGNTALTGADLAAIVQPLEGREVSLAQLQGAANEITQLYVSQGYVTSRAIVPEQEITDGVVQIEIIEGRISEVRVEGNQNVRESYIRSRVQLGTHTPVRVREIEDQLRLLQTSDLFNRIDASLQPGTELGESVLVLQVSENSAWGLQGRFDNYSPPAVGSEILGVTGIQRSLTGWGDRVTLAYDRTTTGGYEVYEGRYQLPVNPMNGTLQLRVVASNNEIPLNQGIKVRGNSERYEVSFRQPLIRSPREEFAVSLGFAYQEGQTFLGDFPFGFGIGPSADGESRTSVFRLGQDYRRRDIMGSWGLRSLFSIGTGLFDATNNESPIPDSQFFSWLGQVQRVQRLSPNQLLLIQGAIQLTPDALLSSEQFVIGGGQSLRGYRQNAKAGDNGWRFSVEDRITVVRDRDRRSILQVAPFFDAGAVWNHPDNPNNAGRSGPNFLAGIGTGILWTPLPNLRLRLDYGLPLIEVQQGDRNLQDEGFYFSLQYQL